MTNFKILLSTVSVFSFVVLSFSSPALGTNAGNWRDQDQTPDNNNGRRSFVPSLSPAGEAIQKIHYMRKELDKLDQKDPEYKRLKKKIQKEQKYIFMLQNQTAQSSNLRDQEIEISDDELSSEDTVQASASSSMGNSRMSKARTKSKLTSSQLDVFSDDEDDNSEDGYNFNNNNSNNNNNNNNSNNNNNNNKKTAKGKEKAKNKHDRFVEEPTLGASSSSLNSSFEGILQQDEFTRITSKAAVDLFNKDHITNTEDIIKALQDRLKDATQESGKEMDDFLQTRGFSLQQLGKTQRDLLDDNIRQLVENGFMR